MPSVLQQRRQDFELVEWSSGHGCPLELRVGILSPQAEPVEA